MNWGLHIDTITNKAKKILGFLRRNLKIRNKKTKETAYKAFVHPILEYSATVWDSHSANSIKTIEKVQCHAAKWVTNRHHQTSCVNSIIDSLAWPTLQQRHKKARLEKFLKCHHHLVSSPLILNTYHSQHKPDQATERTTHTAQDTVQTYVILPPDHPRMEQPAPGNSGNQVPGLFQVQACFPPVTRQTTPPLPPPLLFLMSTTPLYYATHPFTTFQKCILQPPQTSKIITTLMLAD